MTAVLTSASGIISLLDEPERKIQAHALTELNKIVHSFWSEIAPEVSKIEELYEDEGFKQRDLAASVASKVFYHLEELDDSLKYALGAGALFNTEEHSEYVQTLISKSIEDYISKRTAALDKKETPEVDPRLEEVVNKMFERCIIAGKYKQAIGIALESRRIDIIKKSISSSGNISQLTKYTFDLCFKAVLNGHFRQEVLRVLVKLYSELEEPDYINVCQCLLFLDDDDSVASILTELIDKDSLMCYQVAFDLYANQNQPFLNRVLKKLKTKKITVAETETEVTTDKENGEEKKEEEKKTNNLDTLKSILNGETPIKLYLDFLYTHNHSDINILNQIKDKLDSRNSVTHNATVIAHAIMHTGTTVDIFLRNNLDWLGKATNWAKFTATSSLGVVHKGHHTQSLKILEPYLPRQDGEGGDGSRSAYQEGGALYALGLIHVGSAVGDKADYLLNALRNAGSNEIIQHGACLGLGLVSTASQNESIYEEIKSVVYTESAVAGKAAGLAMGLVMLGSGNGEALEEMLKYAHETQHERIIRGLSMGMALIVYGREEDADGLIEQMIRDKNPIIRYGGMYAIAMAYANTGNNTAIRKLLHVAVSDVSDDVRRAAITALGFILCNKPQQVPRLVSLLSESYNAHVRYGACFAVGIACAGTGLPEALNILEPLLKDEVDFVRQGAFIAMSMVLIQHNETQEPKVKSFRKAITDSLTVKGSTMTKLGAIMAAGILDAGGRNMTLSLVSPQGHKKMSSVVGLAIFPQFWYWFPESHFISLAFTPTAIIGLNKDLKMPKNVEFKSLAKPSVYAYPAPIEIKVTEEKKVAKKATLSVSRVKGRGRKKGDNEDVTMKEAPSSEKEKDEEDKKKQEAVAEEPIEEPEFKILSNPTRVTWKQKSVLSFNSSVDNCRYHPIKKDLYGFVLLKDSQEGDDEDLVVSKPPKISQPGVSENEPEAPAPFEFNG